MSKEQNAPERIWADPAEIFDGMDVWRSEPGGKGVEYIRADRVSALVMAARSLIKYSRDNTKLGENWVLSQADLEALDAAIVALDTPEDK